MPITVRHEPSAGVTGLAAVMTGAGAADTAQHQRSAQIAQTAATLGARRDLQIQQIQAQRVAQERDIEARAELQKAAAQDAEERLVLNAGLQQDYQEQQFKDELSRVREAAKLRAKQFEYEYTVDQKRQLAEYNRARQTVMSSRDLDEREKEAALRAIDLQQAEIEPSAIPRDPSKPIFPDGQGIGESWISESGAAVTRDAQGELKLLQREDQSAAYQRDKLEADFRSKVLEIRTELATGYTEFRDKTGQLKSRPRSKEEVDQLAETILAPFRQTEQQQAPQPEPTARPPGEGDFPMTPQLAHWAQGLGVKPTESERGLPEAVAYAQAMLRKASEMDRRGEDVQHMWPVIQEAAAILRRYREQ